MRVGIKDVALRAGVSIGTVSKVFNPDSPNGIRISQTTRERILAVAAELNYSPNYGAKLLRGQSTNTIGFTISLPEEHNRSYLSDYSLRIVNGLGLASSAAGYQLLLINDMEYQSYLRMNRIDGLVLTGYSGDRNPREAEMFETFRHFDAQGYPYVVINNIYDQADIPSICFDNEAAVDLVMRLVLRKGYRRVGFLGQITGNPQRHHCIRCRRLVELLEANGLPVDPRMMINGHHDEIPEVPRVGRYTHEDGYVGARFLHERGCLPDCLVCGSDTIALGVFRAARELKLRIPEDLAVIGFDDMPEAESFAPALTTIRQPLEAMGAAAFQYLQNRLRGGNAALRMLFAPELIERDSA